MEREGDQTRDVTVLSKRMLVRHGRVIEEIGVGGMGEVYPAAARPRWRAICVPDVIR